MDEDERRKISRQNFEINQAREQRNALLFFVFAMIVAFIAIGALLKIGWNMF